MPKNYNATVVFYRAALTMEDLISIAEVLGRNVPDTYTFPDSPMIPFLRHLQERNRYLVLSDEMEDRIYSANPQRNYILKVATFEQEDTGHMHVGLVVVQQGSLMETMSMVRLSNFVPVGYSDVVASLSTLSDPYSFDQPHRLDCDSHSPRATYLLAAPGTSLLRSAINVYMHNPDLWIGENPDLVDAPESFFVPDGFSVAPWDPDYWSVPAPFPGKDIALDIAGGDVDRPRYIVSATRQGDGYVPALEIL